MIWEAAKGVFAEFMSMAGWWKMQSIVLPRSVGVTGNVAGAAASAR